MVDTFESTALYAAPFELTNPWADIDPVIPPPPPIVEPAVLPAEAVATLQAAATPAPVPLVTMPALQNVVRNYPAAEWVAGALRDLVSVGVSDVHLTQSGVDKRVVVEARIDGDLELVRVIEGRDANTIVNMLKTHADISTSSSRVPGDGRYELPIEGYPYRVRAVSLPLFDGGEKIVLRLPQIGEMKTLERIGLTATNDTAVRKLLARPNGMTLIAGPMGEGKTTTAHAAIMAIGTAGRAVIAVEDPVERVLPGVAQIEVEEEVGAGFGDIMRYLVRADFDTLFVGEIRDAATAGAAVRMAKAGRRVISTIHATDNVTAMLRLIELSDDSPLSVLDAVTGVISQRLVRKLDPRTNTFSGRYPIHEVLEVNDVFTDRLIENKSLGDIRAAAVTTSTTFADNLRELVARGITDQSEARRVIGHDV